MRESTDESAPAAATAPPDLACPSTPARRGARLRPRRARRGGDAGQGAVLAVIAVGGAGGACLRHGAALLWPTAPGTFPWTTLGINVVGCAAIGVLMVAVTTGLVRHPLLRPLVGVGVLGGFTTFSTYALDIRTLLAEGRPALAFAYLAGTMLGALGAVALSTAATRRILRGRRR